MNKLLSKKDVQNDLVNLNGWMYDNNKRELPWRKKVSKKQKQYLN